jgi:hypothetical protein
MNRADRMAQMVEHLPSKHEALSLNPSTEKKKRIILVAELALFSSALFQESIIKRFDNN